MKISVNIDNKIQNYQSAQEWVDKNKNNHLLSSFTQKVNFIHIDGTDCTFPNVFLKDLPDFFILFTEHHGCFILDKDEVIIKVGNTVIHKAEVFA
jgi:hypothetical protein